MASDSCENVSLRALAVVIRELNVAIVSAPNKLAVSLHADRPAGPRCRSMASWLHRFRYKFCN